MNRKVDELAEQLQEEIISFAQELVRIQSCTGNEEEIAAAIRNRMEALGFLDVHIDAMGNVIGHFGTGKCTLLFDSHDDTVGVNDTAEWSHDPFGAEIDDGKLYGRGSVDMKSGLVASIYGAYVAHKAGLIPEGASVYVSASTMEEDYDGHALKYELETIGFLPEKVMICEPSNGLDISIGHRGRTLIEVNCEGIACHGSLPELGKNPVYMLREIIGRVEELNRRLSEKEGEHGSIALTNIYCQTASNNSVPQNATIILDRRITAEETEPFISEEMEQLLEGTEATWRFCDIPGKSWVGHEFIYHSFLPAWEIAPEHPFVQAAMKAYREVRGGEPKLFRFNGCTNGISSAGLHGIPTIVMGPGDLCMAHARDEYCPTSDILEAVKIYARLCAV